MAVKRWSAALALAIGLLASAGALSRSHLRTLFLSGQPGPVGLKFTTFGRAAGNTQGSVCFLAGWDGAHHRPEGLFLRQGEQVVPIARAGDLIPGTHGGRFSFAPEYPDDFTSFSLNNQDQVAFIVRQGLYLYRDGAVHSVARIGDQLPGIPDERWVQMLGVSLNDGGSIAFVATTQSTRDGGQHQGVFLAAAGAIKIVLFEGDTVPGLDGGLTAIEAVSVNDAGQMAVLAHEDSDGASAILLIDGTGTRTIALEGQPAPGGVWTDLSSVGLNNRGDIAFQGRVDNNGDEHGGVYLASAGSVTAVAIPGQDTGRGSLTVSLARPVVSDDGSVAFLGQLQSADGPHAMVLAAGGRLSALAVEGQAAPGGLSGTVTRLSGLNLGSLGPQGVLCGMELTGGSVSAVVARCAPGQAAEVILSTEAPLPPGGALALIDGETPPRQVDARINRRGDVVYAADGGGYGRALFRAGTGGAELLTPLGRTTSSDAGILSVVSFDLNDSGQIAYLGVRDPVDRATAIFKVNVAGNASPQVVAETGQAVPGVPGQVITRLGPPTINAQGEMLFAARGALTPDAVTGSACYLLRATGGRLDLLAAEGQPIEGGGTLTGIADAAPNAAPDLFRELQVNQVGQALFLSSYRVGPTGAVVPAGLFLFSSGVVHAVVLPGQKAPLPDAPTYTSLSTPRLSDSGTITFAATVVGRGRKTTAGLFRMNGLNVSKLAAAGDPAPAPDGSSYQTLSDPVADAAGNVAFFALLDPPTPAGSAGAVFISDGSTTRLAVADGDPVGGAGGGMVRLDDGSPGAPLALREDGSILIAARLQGTEAPAGLFLLPPN